MKTLIAISKVAALFSSPLLLGLYVYDRSGGNLFAPRLAPATSVPATEMRSSSSDPGGVMVSFSPEPTAGAWDPAAPVPSTRPIVMTPKSGPVDLTTVPQGATQPPAQSAAPPTLFPGSKSFSGATLIDASTLQVNQSLSPATNYPPPPEPQPRTTTAPTLFPGSKGGTLQITPVANAPVSSQSQTSAPPTLLPGSKSLVMPSFVAPTPPPAYPSPYPSINAPNAPYRQPNASSVPQQSVPQQAVPR